MALILVVEDEVDINNLIRTKLEADGHNVFQAFDGLAALTALDKHSPELIILDWMLPGMDGLAVCRQIRQNYLVPIIMLTARGEEIDRVLGLEIGADDYITKPFSIRELLARVRAILRRVELDTRSNTPSAVADTPLSVNNAGLAGQTSNNEETVNLHPIIQGPLRIDLVERLVKLEGVSLDLTPKEYDMLVLLAGHPGRAFSREFLLSQLWGYDYDGFDRTVDTHITRLRKKLGVLGGNISTVWGVGYRFTL